MSQLIPPYLSNKKKKEMARMLEVTSNVANQMMGMITKCLTDVKGEDYYKLKKTDWELIKKQWIPQG